MPSVSKSFTAVGDGPELLIRRGESFDYDVSGTFVGTVLLQQFHRGGWNTLATATGAASGTVTLDSNKPATRVRFRCTVRSSGTIVTELSAVTTEVSQSVRNAAGDAVLEVSEDGVHLPNDKALLASQTRTGSGSYQPVAIDLEVGATAGSNDGGDPKFLAPIMGNLLGDTLTHAANYLAGLIGADSVTGAKATTYPKGGVLGIIMAGVSESDGAVVAVLDGDGLTVANAAFKAFGNNSTPNSGFDYGLDLKSPAHDGFSALAILKALLRSPNDVCVLEGAGVPVDGTTGDNFAGKGSLYIDITNANHYIQTGAITSPVWKLVTRAA